MRESPGCVLSATMLRSAFAGVALLVMAAVTSCSGVAAPVVESRSGGRSTARAHETPPPPSARSTKLITADSAATAIGYAVRTVTGTAAFTVRTDPQHLLGRPDGYVAAVVVFDERLTCKTLGVTCGAEIEQWPTALAAQHRSAFQLLLVREYRYRYGAVLIRISGALSPAAALEYDQALWRG